MKMWIIDIFPQTAQTRKRIWTCSNKRQNSKDIYRIEPCWECRVDVTGGEIRVRKWIEIREFCEIQHKV